MRKVLRTAALTAGVLAAALSSSAHAQLKKFVVQAGAPVPYTGFLAVYVAQQAGFFKEEGLDVEVRYGSGAPQATQVVSANQADVASATIEPLIAGYDKGIRARIFARTNNHLIFYIAVPEDSPIKTVADLKGKKIGVASFGSAGIPVVKSILRSGGVEVQSDTIVPVGVMDQAMAAIKSGSVQALGLYDGIYYALERAGFKFRYIRHPTLANFGNGGLFASDATLEKKRAEVCGFGRAYAKGVLFATLNPEAALQLYWRAVPAARKVGDEAEALRFGLAEVRPMLRGLDFKFPPEGRYGVIDREAFAKYMEINKQEGVIAAAPPIDAITTTSFSDCINDWNQEDVRVRAKNWKP